MALTKHILLAAMWIGYSGELGTVKGTCIKLHINLLSRVRLNSSHRLRGLATMMTLRLKHIHHPSSYMLDYRVV